ncbi:MAG: S1 RNA-binding domain-containing protein, partial [Ignavibacteriaceae bacterium]|nr:S1 RNA-binding domain-containing protein [Ignavibacteriaceae bacterium]
TNLTKFGAFVDIGIKENGLLHISQITDRFIKDPSEVLKLDQKIMVRIVDIDVERKRIQLSMKEG